MKQDTIESWRKYLNTALLTIIMSMLSVGGIALNNSINKTNEKYDLMDAKFDVMDSRMNGFVIISTLNTERVLLHNDRISELETGQHSATMDRITKTEAYEAVDNLRKYIDKYFERR